MTMSARLPPTHALLDLLAKLYGRRPFPFQTLKFPGRDATAPSQRLHPLLVHSGALHVRRVAGDGGRRTPTQAH